MLPQKSILLEVAPPLLENGKASPTLHEFSRYLGHNRRCVQGGTLDWGEEACT